MGSVPWPVQGLSPRTWGHKPSRPPSFSPGIQAQGGQHGLSGRFTLSGCRDPFWAHSQASGWPVFPPTCSHRCLHQPGLLRPAGAGSMTPGSQMARRGPGAMPSSRFPHHGHQGLVIWKLPPGMSQETLHSGPSCAHLLALHPHAWRVCWSSYRPGIPSTNAEDLCASARGWLETDVCSLLPRHPEVAPLVVTVMAARLHVAFRDPAAYSSAPPLGAGPLPGTPTWRPNHQIRVPSGHITKGRMDRVPLSALATWPSPWWPVGQNLSHDFT